MITTRNNLLLGEDSRLENRFIQNSIVLGKDVVATRSNTFFITGFNNGGFAIDSIPSTEYTSLLQYDAELGCIGPVNDIITLPKFDEDPVTNITGGIYYNTINNKLKVYTPEGWKNIGFVEELNDISDNNSVISDISINPIPIPIPSPAPTIQPSPAPTIISSPSPIKPCIPVPKCKTGINVQTPMINVLFGKDLLFHDSKIVYNSANFSVLELNIDDTATWINTIIKGNDIIEIDIFLKLSDKIKINDKQEIVVKINSFNNNEHFIKKKYVTKEYSYQKITFNFDLKTSKNIFKHTTNYTFSIYSNKKILIHSICAYQNKIPKNKTQNVFGYLTSQINMLFQRIYCLENIIMNSLKNN